MVLVRVVCGIILKEGKILVAQRSESMRLPLKWEFPGGKVQEMETDEECLHRELKEELNIEVQIIGRLKPVIFSSPDLNIELIPFLVQYTAGLLQLLEHRDVRLLRIEDLSRLDWAEADLEIVSQLHDLQLE